MVKIQKFAQNRYSHTRDIGALAYLRALCCANSEEFEKKAILGQPPRELHQNYAQSHLRYTEYHTNEFIQGSVLEANRTYPAAIAVTDSDINLIFCNQEFRLLSGLNSQRLESISLKDILSSWSQKTLDDNFYKDLLDHEISFSTLYLEMEENTMVKCLISHTSYEVMPGHLNRLFTISPSEYTTVEKTQKLKIEEPQASANCTTELHETTQSLIDTNVVLRKEIRDHQLALKALKESESRFRNLTETTSDFIWEIDREGNYTYASPKSLHILGYPPEQLINRKSLLFRDDENSKKFARNLKYPDAEIEGFQGWEYTFIHKNGHTVIMESSGEPIFKVSGELIGFRGIDRDITERVQYEEQLKLAKYSAEKANEAKSEFLANMSHELRTPLHAILSYSHYGEKKLETASKTDLQHYFYQISKSAKRLFPLIDSLLDLSKLEAGKMQYNLCCEDLREEFIPVISEFQHLADRKNISFLIISPTFTPVACFDKQRTGQVIRNVLSNALKFGENGTVITIAFLNTIDKSGNTMLCTTITNKGTEIPDNELDSIFDKFVQSSKTRTGAGGTGLGLSICKKIINDLHGEIWAENGEDQTTRFHFTLPVTPPATKIGQILLQKGLVSQEELEIALRQQHTKII